MRHACFCVDGISDSKTQRDKCDTCERWFCFGAIRCGMVFSVKVGGRRSGSSHFSAAWNVIGDAPFPQQPPKR